MEIQCGYYSSGSLFFCFLFFSGENYFVLILVFHQPFMSEVKHCKELCINRSANTVGKKIILGERMEFDLI